VGDGPWGGARVENKKKIGKKKKKKKVVRIDFHYIFLILTDFRLEQVDIKKKIHF
jgi:hypothetical protein